MRPLGEFRVKEPVADVFRLGTPYIGFYLLAEGGKYTLVDLGLPGYWDLLVRFLANRGSTLFDIEAQILTHHHPEHRGNTARVREQIGSSINIHAAEVSDAAQPPRPPEGPVWPAGFRY